MALLNGFKETETEQRYRRGEIYYINNASKEHVGSEMKKDRPAVIVSCDANNKHSDVLEPTVPVQRSDRGRGRPDNQCTLRWHG